jgi:hypothetical protein
MAKSPAHRTPHRAEQRVRDGDGPGFTRKWVAARLECWFCGEEAVHVFPCKLQRLGGEIAFACECGAFGLHHVDADEAEV